jgi:hypothetical protein
MNQKNTVMKNFLSLMSVFCFALSFGQNFNAAGGDGQILVNNDKVKVVEFTGKPQGNVCGAGTHFHKEHLTVALTDAKVLITSPGGKQQEAEIPAGSAIWFGAGSHTAVNSGEKETKLLLIYLK